MRGGKRPGAGRPPGTKSLKPKRTVVKQVRWTEAEWVEIEKICKEFKMVPSEFIRYRVLNKNHY